MPAATATARDIKDGTGVPATERAKRVVAHEVAFGL